MCPLPFFGYFFYNYPIFLFFRSLFFNFCLISLYSFKDTDSIFVKSLLMEFVGQVFGEFGVGLEVAAEDGVDEDAYVLSGVVDGEPC